MKILSAELVLPDPFVLDEVESRLRNLEPLYAEIIQAWRGIIDQEFAGGYFLPPSGGPRGWAQRVPFGNLSPGGPSRLQKTGALRRAWQGGPGGYQRITSAGATFGVSLPYAAVHRGTSGKLSAALARSSTQIRVTDRMRAFLHANGIHLKASTRALEVPARPHAAVTPLLRTQITALTSAYATGRRLPSSQPTRVAA